MALNDRQARFVEEYLVDLNGAAAARRAGYSAASARQEADRLLTNDDIQGAITKAQAARSERTGITADAVLRQWWDIATADANELIQLRRGCCLRCHGDDPFDPTLDPVAGCPACGGEGVARVHALDSRDLTGKARLLYAGAKQTRDGIEIKMRDQDGALANVAKHLGMFVEKREISGKDGGPMQFVFLPEDAEL